jgi:bla regulator protein BlaR1
MQQNLEFIADNEAQTVSSCEKSYQTLLLKSSVPNYQLVLANNFYNSLIKKRIVMLQKSKSNKLNVWKYALILPVLGIFLMSVNTKNIYVEKVVATEKNASQADPSFENELNSILYASTNNEKKSETSNEVIKTNTKSEQLNQANSIKSQDPKATKVELNHEMALITKDFSDANLESLKNRLNEKGITVKFKGIKRNSEYEITAIKIDVSSKTSNANYHTESDEPISPIKIGYDSDGSKISIGNSNVAHASGHSFAFVSKDGNHKIHSVGSADNVFIIADDDTDEEGEKIVIRKADKVHFSPKANSKVKFISEDGNVTEINDENVVVWESQKGDVDTIHVKKMNKAKAVWINKTDSEDVYAFENGDDNTFVISTGSGENPLYILNGKEISKEEMDAIKPDSIDKVEVLKGDSATKKYGEKGENGVVLITTKNKK